MNAGEILELGNIPLLVNFDRLRFDWFALDLVGMLLVHEIQ